MSDLHPFEVLTGKSAGFNAMPTLGVFLNLTVHEAVMICNCLDNTPNHDPFWRKVLLKNCQGDWHD